MQQCLEDDPGLPFAVAIFSVASGIELGTLKENPRPNASIWGSLDRMLGDFPGADPDWGAVVRRAGTVGRLKRLGFYGTMTAAAAGMAGGYIVGAVGRCYLETR
jgi:hypothetical protein